ncbi:MAG: hypothetical protein ABW184_14490 [Sphingobium sp.]
MVDYRETDRTTVHVEKRSNTGLIIGIIVAIGAIVVAFLFLTGFWSADMEGGSLPKVDVKAEGGSLPDVDVKSKEVVVGTSKTTVDVPKVETEKQEIDVPTVGVRDNGNQ